MKVPLCVTVFFSIVKTEWVSRKGTLGLLPPPFALNGGIGIYQIIFVIESFLFLSLMLFPKKNLEKIQTQVLIFQGLLIGVEHSLNSLTFDIQEFLCWITALVCAFVGGVLSINENFQNTFISIISAYSLTYLITIILRFGNILFCAVTFVILYFIFLFIVKGCSKILIAFSKSFICLLSTFVLIDSWGFISILSFVHGATAKTIFIILGFGLFFLLYICLAGYIFAQAFYGDYLKNKIAGAVGSKADNPAENKQAEAAA